MTTTGDAGADHVRRGLALEQQGDAAGAEAAYAMADDTGSADGALFLGVLLKRRGDLAGAQAAYGRGVKRGDPRAACNLGILLEELGDIERAKAAYGWADARGFPGGAYTLGQLLYAQGDLDGALAAMQRADELGDPDGAFNLGVLLKKRGDVTGAEGAYARAEQRGHPDGATALGKLLRERGDQAAAESAFRRADGQGDPAGAFELGALLYDRGDQSGALPAFERAAQREYPGAGDIMERLRLEVAAASNDVTSNAWIALRSMLETSGAQRLSETALSMEIPRGDTGRTQRVWISYEVVAPDYEFARLHSPFARVGTVNLDEVVRDSGKLIIGSIGYTPSADALGNDIGLLTVGSSIPLMMLNPNDAGSILMYLAVLAGAADQLEARWSGGDIY
jgi:tetratricopeptide (TPR) repeat protein